MAHPDRSSGYTGFLRATDRVRDPGMFTIWFETFKNPLEQIVDLLEKECVCAVCLSEAWLCYAWQIIYSKNPSAT